MMTTIFWSWQSDGPQRETRAIIREALSSAVERLNGALEPADRPEKSVAIDQDTKGLPGSPDIVASIFAKIEAASAFVADITPIGVIEGNGKRRHISNPNVLIELGYAKKALGLKRIIQVWNTAITECTVEDLPFDMKGRRGPISFHLPANSDTETYRKARALLTERLFEAIDAIEPKVDRKSEWPEWKPVNADSPAIWFREGQGLTVNEPHHGSGKKFFPTAPTQYARILPKEWKRPENLSHSNMLGYVSGFSWGRTEGGILTYSGTIARPELAESSNGTIQFLDTGELWAIDRLVVTEWRNKLMFHGDDMFDGVVQFLDSQIPALLGNGASLPLKIRLGVDGLLESHWPTPNPYFGEPAALERSVETEGEITEASPNQIEELVSRYWREVRDAFGIEPPDSTRIAAAMRVLRKE